MVLLTVLAVGLLGLSSIEIRSSSRNVAMQQARANARMAMVMAVGSLQKYAGPDQRVTGPSDFLASQGSGGSAKQPHWTAVWKSVMPDGGPVIRRQGNGGGLRDRRSLEGWNVQDDLLAQLVSGNENGTKYTGDSDAGNESSQEVLVGKGSLGNDVQDNSGSIVRVPKVAIAETEDGKPSGEYAWWVGDLGTKANIATADHFAEKSGSTIRRLQIAQDYSVAGSGQADSENEDRERFVSPGEFGLQTSGGDASLAKEHFHDFTTDSESLLVDVRDGGLKKDLTAYLLGTGNIGDLPNAPGMEGLGVKDDDNLIGAPNKQAESFMADGGESSRMTEVSPSFQLLRDFAKRADSTPLTMRTANPDYPQTRQRKDDQVGYGGHNTMPVEFKNRTKSDVTPVLVESSIYYNLSYYDTNDTDTRFKTGLRLHLYPRVVLWNPYNTSLKVGASMVGMQINGAKEIEVTLTDGRKQIYKMCWGRMTNERGQYSGTRRGTHYFQLEGTTIGPGETVVFSPSGNRPYEMEKLSANVLTPGLAPDPTRSFYMDKRPDDEPPNPGPPSEKHSLFHTYQSRPPNAAIRDDRTLTIPVKWREVVGAIPAGNVQAAGYTQADDYWMFWKPFPPGAKANSLTEFNNLPHGRWVSCAYQYGDEDEFPVQWSASTDLVPFQKSDSAGVTRQIPDRRTRDGFRMRWFREPQSNVDGSGSLKGTPHLEDSPIADWNVRASYSFRSAMENVTDVAPHFFGIYTRDLFDDDVSWNNMMPRGSGGTQLGDPFGQPVSGMSRILFDVPRTGAEVVSLGAFQHLKFSEFIWHPTYAFGNSLADPRCERSMTQPDRAKDVNSRDGGWNRDSIGYSTDGRSNNNNAGTASDPDNWAYAARGMLEHIAKEQNTIFDLSYELNHSLWDRYFLSTGTNREKSDFVKDPASHPLPNGRLRPVNASKDLADDLVDFHRAASAVTVDGGFNVNSTSVDAWEALLLSSLGVQGGDTVTFPRIFNLPRGNWDGKDASSQDAWTGQRALSRGEVKKLAQSIVEEVKLRGPFLSLADFVNRRLREDETGKMGALEAALKRSGINSAFRQSYPLNNTKSLPNYKHMDNIKDPTRVEQTLKPDTGAWGALGNLTQADLLQSLGPVLSARSDTFVIRTYGSSLDADGKVIAEAWCEAVVQRTPVPLVADQSGLNPDTSKPIDFGRTFEVKRFRWLHRDEI
ncbi:hypothetical protein [Luteolibacter soli]|uniref:Verru_Chthon cassette protein A n=1 Tax=Luteolibacter soli TaxID=3135280 RepID=A0ABU9B125_9BACT